MSRCLGLSSQQLTSVTLSWSSHPLEVSDSLGPHHPPKSYLLHHIRMACFSFQPSLSCSHPFSFLRQHLHPHSMLSSSPATLSGLMISFLLMVPEAASPSGPPSSRMSRTSAPVAITPERWGSTPRDQGSVPAERPCDRQGGGAPVTAAPSGGRVKRQAARRKVQTRPGFRLCSPPPRAGVPDGRTVLPASPVSGIHTWELQRQPTSQFISLGEPTDRNFRLCVVETRPSETLPVCA